MTVTPSASSRTNDIAGILERRDAGVETNVEEALRQPDPAWSPAPTGRSVESPARLGALRREPSNATP